MGLIVDSAVGLNGMTPPLAPLSKTEAEAIAWFHAFCARHDLAVAYRCVFCFKANRPDGCNQRGEKCLTPRSVRITCRCGVREYTAPMGTGDLATHLSNTAKVMGDETTSHVNFDNGESADLPAQVLTDEEAGIIRFYHRIVKAIGLTPKLIHKPCWDRRTADASMMHTHVDDGQIGLFCKCRVWFYQGATRSH